MDAKKRYEEWLANPYFDDAVKDELKSIACDEKEIEERFYRDLEFGTGGLRGIIGAGTNRMNIYTVRKATQGLANFIRKENAQEKGVAIAYDSRNMSPEFAEEAALCLAANGIKAYIFPLSSPHAHAFFRFKRAWLHGRDRGHGKPQSAGVQRLQGILGGRRPDHISQRRADHRRG